jgi:transposase
VRDYELDAAQADAARLGEALKEMVVKLMLVEGSAAWFAHPRSKCSALLR